MKRYTPHIKQLLTAKGFSCEYDRQAKRLVCSAVDGYGLVFHIFRMESQGLEITTMHSLCVEEYFLSQAEQIIGDTNPSLARGEFLLSENGTIILSTLYREDPPEGPSLKEVCLEIFRTGALCRQEIFENMLCQRQFEHI